MESIHDWRRVRFYLHLSLILMILMVLAVWIEYRIRGELGVATEWVEMAKSHFGRDVLIAGGVLYALLLSLPFVPGVELGLLLMCVFGKEGIVFVYFFTVAGLSLAFLVGQSLPKKWIVSLLQKLGSSEPCTDHCDETREMLAQSKFGQKFRQHRLGSYVLRYRYMTLALLFNLPGNYLLGGGGGIALACGASRCLPRRQFLLTVVLATSPVPILAFFGLIQVEALLAM